MCEADPPPPVEDLGDLYENAPSGHLSMLPDGSILKINATLAGWIGASADKVVGKRFGELLTIGTRIIYETHFAPQLMMQGSCDEISLDLRTSNDGAKVPVLASGRVYKDADGQPLLMRLAFLKATERRRYESQLIDAREHSKEQELAIQSLLKTERETAELRDQFIAVLGHDLRNPLASISGGVRLLRKDPPVERRNLFLDMLDGSVVRMSGLIDNVLDFARGRLGSSFPLDLRPEVFVEPILEQIVSELRLGVPDRTIETDFDVPVPIECDSSRIGQLVSNLVGNALTHGDAEQAVRVHADTTGEWLTIWVANSGKPIPPEMVEHLFRPFFRGEAKPSQQGLGLGLHIAFEIARAHGGTLEARSMPEETRFTFRMPIAPERLP